MTEFPEQQIVILEDGNNIYLIFYILHIVKKCNLKTLFELLFNSTVNLKFSCSTKDELNLVYDKISNNCILINL